MQTAILKIFATWTIIVAVGAMKFTKDDYFHICFNIFTEEYLNDTKGNLEDAISSITKNADQRSTWDKITFKPVKLHPNSENLLDLLNGKKPFFDEIAGQGWIASDQADQYIDDMKSIYIALSSCAQQGQEWSKSCEKYRAYFKMDEDAVLEEVHRLQKEHKEEIEKMWAEPNKPKDWVYPVDEHTWNLMIKEQHNQPESEISVLEEPVVLPHTPTVNSKSEAKKNDSPKDFINPQAENHNKLSPKIDVPLKNKSLLEEAREYSIIVPPSWIDQAGQRNTEITHNLAEIKVKEADVGITGKLIEIKDQFLGFFKSRFGKKEDVSPLNYGILNPLDPNNDPKKHESEKINEESVAVIEPEKLTEIVVVNQDKPSVPSVPIVTDQVVQKKRKRRRVIVFLEQMNCMYCYKDNLLIDFIQRKYFIWNKF